MLGLSPAMATNALDLNCDLLSSHCPTPSGAIGALEPGDGGNPGTKTEAKNGKAGNETDPLKVVGLVQHDTYCTPLSSQKYLLYLHRMNGPASVLPPSCTREIQCYGSKLNVHRYTVNWFPTPSWSLRDFESVVSKSSFQLRQT